MRINEFLSLVGETLEFEGEINIDDNVDDIEAWDSLGILSIVSMLDGMGIAVELEQLSKVETIKAFVNLAGIVDDPA